MLSKMREYPQWNESDARLLARRASDGLESSLFIIQTPFGYRRVAEMFRPESGESFAAILFVHWYEPESPNSNRSQFVEEAKELARGGAVCLLIETLWSDPDFFIKRTQADDFQNSLEEVVNIRRALDMLLAQPDIDLQRVAYVGHDFGGMYGVLAGSLDQRPSHYVIMAATPRFPDWYLYLPKMEGAAREAFIREMVEIDPISHIANLSPASVFFQFAANDPHVPKDRAQEFYAAAKDPKSLRWYETGHGLNEAATADRKAWLKDKLGLK